LKEGIEEQASPEQPDLGKGYMLERKKKAAVQYGHRSLEKPRVSAFEDAEKKREEGTWGRVPHQRDVREGNQ